MDRTVLDAILKMKDDEKAVLATIISTTGSTPRKAGAQVLVFPNGRSIGTIGGGFGEAEVKKHALGVFKSEEPKTVKVEMNHETASDDGMVCGGNMEVFLELIRL